MDFHHELKNEKLKKMVEKKAQEWKMTPDDVIWAYINRGLLDDGLGEHVFEKMHSEKFLKQINDALDVD